MRICSLNAVFLENTPQNNDGPLQKYLKEQSDNSYLSVTMRGIRNNARNQNNAQFLRKFFDLYGEPWKDLGDDFKEYLVDFWRQKTWRNFKRFLKNGSISVGVTLLTFVFGLIYFLSRVATLLYPVFIVLYLYLQHNVNVWTADLVDPFQRVMLTVYLALCAILLVLLCVNCSEQYLTAHFLPSSSNVRFPSSTDRSVVLERVSRQVMDHYFGMIVEPIRKAMVTEKFGPDLAPIILSYLPKQDHYGKAGADALKPKVVI